MAYPVKAVANAILHIAEEHGAVISPLKLQKLVYVAHGWSLGLTGQPLVGDELPEAWQYGPVFPSLYQEFKDFGKGPVSRRATAFEVDDGTFCLVEPEVPSEDSPTWSLLRRIWDVYGKFGAIGLSDLTHRDGTPWQRIYSRAGGIKNLDIPNEVISAHYSELAQKRPAHANA